MASLFVANAVVPEESNPFGAGMQGETSVFANAGLAMRKWNGCEGGRSDPAGRLTNSRD
jgi:hypothetical protein